MATLEQINIFNMRYNNITPAAQKYAQVSQNLSSAMTRPRGRKYSSVNQLLKESPLVGSTKLGLNFIA